MITKRTFCRFCHAACPIEVDVSPQTGEVVAVRGDAQDPLFGAYTCIKGRALGDQHHNPDRLRTALKRQPDGSFVEMPTSAALDEIAAKLRALIATNGPRSFASYCGTATFQNAAAHPVIRAFHKAVESPSFYTSITIDQPAKLVTPLRLGSWAAGAHLGWSCSPPIRLCRSVAPTPTISGRRALPQAQASRAVGQLFVFVSSSWHCCQSGSPSRLRQHPGDVSRHRFQRRPHLIGPAGTQLLDGEMPRRHPTSDKSVDLGTANIVRRIPHQGALRW